MKKLTAEESAAKRALIDRMEHYKVTCAEIPDMQTDAGKPLYLRLRTTNSRRAITESRIREVLYDADKKFEKAISVNDLAKRLNGLFHDRCTVQTRALSLSTTKEKGKKNAPVRVPQNFYDGLAPVVRAYDHSHKEKQRIQKRYQEALSQSKREREASEQLIKEQLRNRPTPFKKVTVEGPGGEKVPMLIKYKKVKRAKQTKPLAIKDIEEIVQRSVRLLLHHLQQNGLDVRATNGMIPWRDARKLLMSILVSEYRRVVRERQVFVEEEQLTYAKAPKSMQQ